MDSSNSTDTNKELPPSEIMNSQWASPPLLQESDLFDVTEIFEIDYLDFVKNRRKVQFRENLVISSVLDQNQLLLGNNDSRAIGGLVIDVQLTGHEPRNFIVFISTQLMHDGHNGGSHITSFVLPSLHTLEEKRIEYLKLDKNLVDQKELYVSLQSQSYYVSAKQRLETTLKKQNFSFEQTKNLILEGASIILMRYMAILRYVGELEMTTHHWTGDLCLNTYKTTGPHTAIVNNVRCNVITIHRCIREKCGIVHNSITTLLLSGHIVRQEWENTPVFFHLNPLVRVVPNDPSSLSHIPLFYNWQNDMQLFSRYMDFKTKRLALYKNYYEDHPELKQLIADYCQYVLMKKPEDVLDFTIYYFKNLDVREVIPHNTYMA